MIYLLVFVHIMIISLFTALLPYCREKKPEDEPSSTQLRMIQLLTLFFMFLPILNLKIKIIKNYLGRSIFDLPWLLAPLASIGLIASLIGLEIYKAFMKKYYGKIFVSLTMLVVYCCMIVLFFIVPNIY